jgi:hypothetical protein
MYNIGGWGNLLYDRWDGAVICVLLLSSIVDVVAGVFQTNVLEMLERRLAVMRDPVLVLFLLRESSIFCV